MAGSDEPLKKFEKILEDALRQRGWGHTETIDLPDVWWAARAWRIRSVGENFGYELTLTFAGHYQDGNTVNFDSSVYEILVGEEIIDDHLTTNAPVTLKIDSRDYPGEVSDFVDELSKLRIQKIESNKNF